MTGIEHVANVEHSAETRDRIIARGGYGLEDSFPDRQAVLADPVYGRTPLRLRPEAAKELELACVAIKDESARLAEAGLGSFKVLGVLAGVYGSTKHALDGAHTLVCATDGNYGRALAWAARRTGRHARIFVPEAISPARAQAIADQGASVERVPGGYDASMAAAARAARADGVCEVSDTATTQHDPIPLAVSRSFGLIADECLTAWPTGLALPSHVFLPVGAGALAAGMVAGFRTRLGARSPRVVTVEPRNANALMSSVRTGRLQTQASRATSLMVGLACETPSACAWPVLHTGVDDLLAISEQWAVRAMRELADGRGDPGIIAGESGAAAYAGLLASARDPVLRAALGLGSSSRVLVPITEGATDPLLYSELVHATAGQPLNDGARPDPRRTEAEHYD